MGVGICGPNNKWGLVGCLCYLDPTIGVICEFCIPSVEQIEIFNVTHINSMGCEHSISHFVYFLFKIAGEVNIFKIPGDVSISLWVLIDKEGLKWFSFLLVYFHICSTGCSVRNNSC